MSHVHTPTETTWSSPSRRYVFRRNQHQLASSPTSVLFTRLGIRHNGKCYMELLQVFLPIMKICGPSPVTLSCCVCCSPVAVRHSVRLLARFISVNPNLTELNCSSDLCSGIYLIKTFLLLCNNFNKNVYFLKEHSVALKPLHQN